MAKIRKKRMLSYDVFLDSFVNVTLPEGVDPNSQEGMDIIWPQAIEKYQQKLSVAGEVHFTWKRYPDGDTTDSNFIAEFGDTPEEYEEVIRWLRGAAAAKEGGKQ